MWPFDRNNAQMYQQYAQAYDTGNYNGFDPTQIVGQLSQFILGAPQDMQMNVYQQHFAQLPYQQREFLARQMPPEYGINPNDPFSLSQGLMRLGQEQPGLLQRILGHPIMLGGAMALAGLVAKHMINTHLRNEEYPPYGNPQPPFGGPQYGGQPYGEPPFGPPPYPGNPGYPDPRFDGNGGGWQRGPEGFREHEMRRELARDEREIERLERRDEREIEHLERREEHHHHHREDGF